MNDIFVLADSGDNFRFDNDAVLGMEKNRMVKYTFNGRSVKKSVMCFGGIKFALHDGKTLIALNKTFYIKE